MEKSPSREYGEHWEGKTHQSIVSHNEMGVPVKERVYGRCPDWL